MYVVRRSSHNPLIAPVGDRGWEARAAFNPSPVQIGTDTHLLYRALGHPDALMAPGGISTIGHAVSPDGKHFESRHQFITPTEEWDRFGCEDPRVTYFEGAYVTFYTALGGVPFGAGNIKVGAAISKNLEKVDEKHLITPFNAKAMSLFPERVGGKVTAILTAHTDEPPAHIAVAQTKELSDFWDPKFWEKWHAKLGDHIIDPRRSGEDHVEAGAAPVKTKYGWLHIYSYIEHYFGGGERVFGIEALLLDLKDPRKIVGRTEGPILVPEESYERYGMVPNIVFPTGALVTKDDRLDIYYGAADTVCARASLYLPDLLEGMVPARRAAFAARAKNNPILEPTQNEWEKKAAFNTAALDLKGQVHLLYRAMSEKNTSVFGYAASRDGVKITERLDRPAYEPREEFEQKKGSPDGNSGCEDPRLTKIGSTIYVTYTAYDGVHVPRAAISSISEKDFLAHKFDKWKKPQLVTPDNVDDKDMCLFPEKINGQYMLIHRIGGRICADLVDSLDFSSRRVNRCIEIMGPRAGMWDSQKIGVAGPPIKTKKGWLLIYHGISKHQVYRLGAALLDLKIPSVVLARTVDPILEPATPYECRGQVGKVVFSCGAVVRPSTKLGAGKDDLLIYYGGGDSVTGVATISFKRLLDILDPKAL